MKRIGKCTQASLSLYRDWRRLLQKGCDRRAARQTLAKCYGMSYIRVAVTIHNVKATYNEAEIWKGMEEESY